MSTNAFVTNALPAQLFKPEYAPLLAGILRGVEKESLRVSADGKMAQTPHPQALGSALTHPQITTDFSEALLEFITPPSHLLSQLMEQLESIHKYSYRHLNDEMLWVSSMPCMVGGNDDIPVARYGSSNRGQMKTVYRVGLGHRYGRVMQTVAGLHYNFSLPRAFWAFLHQHEGSNLELKKFIDRRYFDLIRNFRRYYWLLLYLFGASPAMCRSFVKGRKHDLLPLGDDEHTLHLPYATTLRMGDLGYQSSAQEDLFVCYNARNTYVNTLGKAIFTPYAPYKDIGQRNEAGERIQLNTSLLQIENEFYSAIRPKRTAEAGETALTALCQRGVEYIEVRCLDIDPFSPIGLTELQARFLDTFLLYCLFKPSEPCDVDEYKRIGRNHKRVVKEGRKPGLMLELPQSGEMSLQQWGEQLLQAMQPVAEMLDAVHGQSSDYSEALAAQLGKIKDASLTPSAKVLAELTQNNLTFAAWGRQQSKRFKEQVLQEPLSAEQQKRFEHLAKTSIDQQTEEEKHNDGSFEEYLEAYYSQYYRCCSG